MKRRVFLIIAVLPIIMVMAGCDSGSGGTQTAQSSLNEQHIYIHHVDDSYNPWNDAFKPMSDFSKGTRDTMNSQYDTVQRMQKSNADIFNILNSARQQRP